MRIFLVGFMGAGKSTIGRALAGRLGWQFADLDREIEKRAGAPIPELIGTRGESAFRELERGALEALRSRQRLVVATGGGAFCSDENIELMNASGTTIWLEAPFSLLAGRVEASPRVRPLFRDRESARRLLERREPFYRRAHLKVDCAKYGGVECAVERIVQLLKDHPCVT